MRKTHEDFDYVSFSRNLTQLGCIKLHLLIIVISIENKILHLHHNSQKNIICVQDIESVCQQVTCRSYCPHFYLPQILGSEKLTVCKEKSIN